MTDLRLTLCLLLPLAACGSSSGSDGGPDAGSPDDAAYHALPSATATQLAVGRLHSCALTTAGTVRCWGTSYYGQLGNGAPFDTTDYVVPVEVSGLTGVTAISAHDGDHTCALTAAGGVKCWGVNTYGQLGHGKANSATPIDVDGLGAGVLAVSAGGDHTCALTAAGGVKCWGFNEYGRLGNGSTEDSATPVDVVGLTSGVASIAVGDKHSCAVTTQGALWCWGSNVDGEIGDGTNNTAYTPVQVTGLATGVAAVTTGYFTTCAITTAGAAKCWGLNDTGQVGNGVSSDVGGGGDDPHAPTAVTGLASGVTSLSTSLGLACAVASGATLCWGDEGGGRLGDNGPPSSQSFVPTGVTGLATGSASVGAGVEHSCALSTTGAVKCWGVAVGGGGSLGNGKNEDSPVPVAVVSLP